MDYFSFKENLTSSSIFRSRLNNNEVNITIYYFSSNTIERKIIQRMDGCIVGFPMYKKKKRNIYSFQSCIDA